VLAARNRTAARLKEDAPPRRISRLQLLPDDLSASRYSIIFIATVFVSQCIGIGAYLGNHQQTRNQAGLFSPILFGLPSIDPLFQPDTVYDDMRLFGYDHPFWSDTASSITIKSNAVFVYTAVLGTAKFLLLFAACALIFGFREQPPAPSRARWADPTPVRSSKPFSLKHWIQQHSALAIYVLVFVVLLTFPGGTLATLYSTISTQYSIDAPYWVKVSSWGSFFMVVLLVPLTLAGLVSLAINHVPYDRAMRRAIKPPWTAHWDEATQAIFFCHLRTSEVVWAMPPGWLPAGDALKGINWLDLSCCFQLGGEPELTSVEKYAWEDLRGMGLLFGGFRSRLACPMLPVLCVLAVITDAFMVVKGQFDAEGKYWPGFCIAGTKAIVVLHIALFRPFLDSMLNYTLGTSGSLLALSQLLLACYVSDNQSKDGLWYGWLVAAGLAAVTPLLGLTWATLCGLPTPKTDPRLDDGEAAEESGQPVVKQGSPSPLVGPGVPTMGVGLCVEEDDLGYDGVPMDKYEYDDSKGVDHTSIEMVENPLGSEKAGEEEDLREPGVYYEDEL
jgi:hypothetical protein